MPLPLHYVRRLTVVSLLVYTNTYGSDMYVVCMYYNNLTLTCILFFIAYPDQKSNTQMPRSNSNLNH